LSKAIDSEQLSGLLERNPLKDNVQVELLGGERESIYWSRLPDKVSPTLPRTATYSADQMSLRKDPPSCLRHVKVTSDACSDRIDRRDGHDEFCQVKAWSEATT
jgi:hypothetical protein